MASTAHLISITIRANNEASNAIAQANNGLKQLGANLTSLGTKMTAGLTAPIVGAGVAMFKTFSDFESVIAELGARTGATAEEMQKMSKFALEMGRTTAFSATEAAQGLLELTSSGSSAAEAMAILPDVLNLAAAGNLELGRAADAVTDILATYKLAAKDAASVTDILAQAAGASSATVEDLLQGFSNVGPVAEQFGMSVADTAAVLAVFSENGIKSAEAGTQLKSMLTNMARTTEPAKEAWSELGVSMFDAQGNMKNVDDLFKEINAAMEGMSTQKQIELTQALAGTHGMLGFNILRTNNGFSGMRDAMNDGTGAAEVAAARMNTLSGKFDQLMGSLETLGIVMGGLAQGPLLWVIEGLTNMINAFSAWAEANPAMAQTVMIILAILAALGPLLIIIGQLISAIVAIKAAFVAMAGIGAILSGAFLPIVAAIGLVIAIGILLISHWNELGTTVTQLAFLVAKGWEGIWHSVSTTISQIGTLIAKGWEGIWKSISTTAAQIGFLLINGLKNLPQKMALIGQLMMQGLWNGIVEGFKRLVVFILAKANEIIQNIRKAFGIASPSKVMMKMGENIVQGFHKGIESMGGIGVNVPQAGGVQSRQPSLAVASGGTSGGNVFYNTFVLPEGTTRQQAREFMRIVGEESERRGAKKIK